MEPGPAAHQVLPVPNQAAPQNLAGYNPAPVEDLEGHAANAAEAASASIQKANGRTGQSGAGETVNGETPAGSASGANPAAANAVLNQVGEGTSAQSRGHGPTPQVQAGASEAMNGTTAVRP